MGLEDAREAVRGWFVDHPVGVVALAVGAADRTPPGEPPRATSCGRFAPTFEAVVETYL